MVNIIQWFATLILKWAIIGGREAGSKSVSSCYDHITLGVAKTDIRNLYGSNVTTKIILIKAKISKIN